MAPNTVSPKLAPPRPPMLALVVRRTAVQHTCTMMAATRRGSVELCCNGNGELRTRAHPRHTFRASPTPSLCLFSFTPLPWFPLLDTCNITRGVFMRCGFSPISAAEERSSRPRIRVYHVRMGFGSLGFSRTPVFKEDTPKLGWGRCAHSLNISRSMHTLAMRVLQWDPGLAWISSVACESQSPFCWSWGWDASAGIRFQVVSARRKGCQWALMLSRSLMGFLKTADPCWVLQKGSHCLFGWF